MKEPKPESILAARLAIEAMLNPALARNESSHGAASGSAYRNARDAMRLCDLARRATTLAARQCNGREAWDPVAKCLRRYWTDADQASCDRSLAKIEKTANEILTPYGAKVLTVHGDPRGCVMRLSLASGATNGAGDGWGL